jgi:ribose transport system permease protein
MKFTHDQLLLRLLNQAPLVLFALVLGVFAAISPRFFTAANLSNILLQAAPTAVVAFGMTFVLLTAGVDLSVGAIMFLVAAVGGKLILGGVSLWVALPVMLLVGTAVGGVNALLVTRVRIIAFIATLATFYIGRGGALWITRTRAMNLPPEFLALGSGSLLGVPVPILIGAGVLALAHLVLSHTPFGRQVYAVGHSVERARLAGINTHFVFGSVYAISGACAALGAILSLGQLGAVSPTFGLGKEFAAIAAAVLGGTSLFGGRGRVFPGTLLGAVLIQTVENGLVIRNEDPYLYPLITSAIIFVAVLTDSLREALLARLTRRKIRMEEPA